MSQWQVIDWTGFAFYLFLVGLGVYQIAFAERIVARREASGPSALGRFDPGRIPSNPRIAGALIIAIGLLGLARRFALI
jgi:hypothetical protein